MKLKPLALGLATGILCALYMLVVAVYPAVSEALFGSVQGESLKALMEDIYPYYGDGVWYDTYVGIVFGFIDGFVLGVVFGGLYNWVAGGEKKGRKKRK